MSKVATVSELRCEDCGYRWLPRQPKPPVRCPQCGSRKWQGEKK